MYNNLFGQLDSFQFWEGPYEYKGFYCARWEHVHIHDGYRVIYSIEEHPIGLCTHISISVESKTKYPHEMAVETILKAFEIPPIKENLAVWLDKEWKAVNLLHKKADKDDKNEE